MFSQLRRGVGVCVLLGVLASACGETAATVDTETNWFRECANSDECSSGSCRCGVCTLTCESDASCASLANATCALAESPGHDTQCGAGVETESICLPRCDGESSCELGEVCSVGVCTKIDDPGSGGSGGGSTGAAAGGTGGTGGTGDPVEPCPQNPRAACAVDCSDVESFDCGAVGSWWDADGCIREGCYTDGDCGLGRRCFGIGPGEPEICATLFTCYEDEAGCNCGGGAACWPGYCVPL